MWTIICNMPKVSVIIPVYNVEKYLRQCLDSVVNQTLRDIEIICVDDGSTDGSAAILAEYAEKDTRFKVIKLDHCNAGACRNAAMAVAMGEYLGFVDADDFCDLTLFEKAYNVGKTDDADVVSFRFKQYEDSSAVCCAEHFFPTSQCRLSRPFAPVALGDAALAPLTHAPWARLVRKTFVEDFKIRFQETERMNDVYFCCMVTVCASRLSLVDESLYFYRKGHGGNLQSGIQKTPTLVFDVWRTVAEGLSVCDVMDTYRRSFFSASANSFFYVLGAMPSLESAEAFYDILRGVYADDLLFRNVKVDDIAFSQTRRYFELMKEFSSVAEFFIRQRSYLQDRLVREKWDRVAAEKSVYAQKKREAKIWAERGAFLAERNALREKVEEQKARESKIWAERGMFLAERNALREKVEEQKVKEAMIWSQRCKYLKERDKFSSEICNLELNLRKLGGAFERMENDLKGVRESVAYRIGSILTWPFRMVYNFYKTRNE